MPSPTDLQRAITAFPDLATGHATPLGHGLIHQTYRVDRGNARFVLQRLSPIFAPEVNLNIRAVTEHLAGAGLATARLLAAADGRPWVDLGEAGIWRAQTWVDGASFDVPQSPTQVRAAGALIGRFHSALASLRHEFVAMRSGAHDMGRHFATLQTAVATHPAHRLRPQVEALAAALTRALTALTPQVDLVTLVGHGDLKLNNVRFGGAAPPLCDQAVCLIDLDTVGPIALAFELGDAWRSWCNPRGEDAVESVEFDLGTFAASLAGYRAGLGRELEPVERSQLLDGVEWISLELAARFAADALNESYFGWNPERHPGRGEHNLHRARVQFAVHQGARRSRAERAELLGL